MWAPASGSSPEHDTPPTVVPAVWRADDGINPKTPDRSVDGGRTRKLSRPLETTPRPDDLHVPLPAEQMQRPRSQQQDHRISVAGRRQATPVTPRSPNASEQAARARPIARLQPSHRGARNMGLHCPWRRTGQAAHCRIWLLFRSRAALRAARSAPRVLAALRAARPNRLTSCLSLSGRSPGRRQRIPKSRCLDGD